MHHPHSPVFSGTADWPEDEDARGYVLVNAVPGPGMSLPQPVKKASMATQPAATPLAPAVAAPAAVAQDVTGRGQVTSPKPIPASAFANLNFAEVAAVGSSTGGGASSGGGAVLPVLPPHLTGGEGSSVQLEPSSFSDMHALAVSTHAVPAGAAAGGGAGVSISALSPGFKTSPPTPPPLTSGFGATFEDEAFGSTIPNPAAPTSAPDANPVTSGFSSGGGASTMFEDAAFGAPPAPPVPAPASSHAVAGSTGQGFDDNAWQ